MPTLPTPAALAAVLALTIGFAAARAQDCDPHMLSGPDFADAFPITTGDYPRVGVTWDPDGPGPLAEVAVIGGAFSPLGTYILAWDGRQFTPLGAGLNGIVRALAVYNGELIAGGEFFVGNSRLAKWNGASWEPFAGGANHIVYALHVHNNELYAGGNFSHVNGQPIPKLARWNGTQWQSVGTPNGTVRALTTHQGELYAAGEFQRIDGVLTSRVARWEDGATWAGLSGEINDVVYALHSTTIAGEPQLLIGGNFFIVDGAVHAFVARWNGTAWTDEDTRFTPGPIFRFAEFASRVVAAGGISAVYQDGVFTPINALAQWDGQRWSAIDGAIHTSSAGQALVVYNGALIVGGSSFATGQFLSPTVTGLGKWTGPGAAIAPLHDGVIAVDSAVRFNNRIVAAGTFRFNDLGITTGLAEWDGARWRPFGSTPVSPTRTLCLATDGESLVVFGEFTTFAGIPAQRVARWRNGAWEAMGAMSVQALAANAVNGEFYASRVNQLYRWDGAAWQLHGPPVTGSIRIIAAFEGRLLVGAAGGLFQWSEASQGWTHPDLPGGDIGIPAGGVTTINTLNGQLLIGGGFTAAFGVTCNGLVVWNGKHWACADIGGAVSRAAVAPEGIYYRGTFELPSAPGVRNLALWNGSSLEPVTHDNPTYSAPGAIAALNGEALLFQRSITSADARTAYAWTRITREGGIPAIAQHPESGTFAAGDTLDLSVTIPFGYEPTTYQWRKGKANLVDAPGGAGGSGVVSGSSTAALTITTISPDDAGSFSVLISTICGDIVSDPASITITGDPACLTDFNHDGIANSTDVSDFINAWFDDQLAGTLLTDFNHDGAVNSTDVSDFINAWFIDQAAGCG